MRLPTRAKKGVSPLIATVLLIAFAVALGAVVMNWGKAQLEEQFSASAVCRDVEIRWFDVAGSPDVCFDGSEVKMTVQNGPKMELSGLKIIIDGTQDLRIADSAAEGPIGKADPKKVNIPYDPQVYGSIRKVQVIPKISVAGEESVCPLKKAIEIHTIPDCSPG